MLKQRIEDIHQILVKDKEEQNKLNTCQGGDCKEEASTMTER